MLKRHVLWWMIVFMNICCSFVIMNINIAIVSMVNERNTTTKVISQQPADIICPNTTFTLREFFKNGNSSSSKLRFSLKTGYDWSEAEQNMILSGFYRLTYLSIFPGGILSHKYGSKFIIGFTQFTTSLLASFIVVMAGYGPVMVSWIRAMQGMLLFIGTPSAVFTIIGKWSPPEERGKFGATFLVGVAVGEALGNFMFGYIAEYVHWKYVFYFTTLCGIIWSILWYILIHDSPKQHPTISIAEKEYIENSISETSCKIKPPIPWKNIATSVPFIICTFAVNSGMWAFVMINTYSPLYLKTVYGMSSNEIGIISSVPYFTTIAAAFTIAYYCDLFVKKGWLSITTIRKICTFLGSVVTAIPIIILTFMKCNVTLAISCILFICVVRSFGSFGATLGVLDLRFCGVLEGIVGTLGAVQLFIFSTAVNYITKILNIAELWKVVFLFTALYSILMNLVFIIFGTSKVQPWNFEDGRQEIKYDQKKMPEKEMKMLLQK